MGCNTRFSTQEGNLCLINRGPYRGFLMTPDTQLINPTDPQHPPTNPDDPHAVQVGTCESTAPSYLRLMNASLDLAGYRNILGRLHTTPVASLFRFDVNGDRLGTGCLQAGQDYSNAYPLLVSLTRNRGSLSSGARDALRDDLRMLLPHGRVDSWEASTLGEWILDHVLMATIGGMLSAGLVLFTFFVGGPWLLNKLKKRYPESFGEGGSPSSVPGSDHLTGARTTGQPVVEDPSRSPPRPLSPEQPPPAPSVPQPEETPATALPVAGVTTTDASVEGPIDSSTLLSEAEHTRRYGPAIHQPQIPPTARPFGVRVPTQAGLNYLDYGILGLVAATTAIVVGPAVLASLGIAGAETTAAAGTTITGVDLIAGLTAQQRLIFGVWQAFNAARTGTALGAAAEGIRRAAPVARRVIENVMTAN